MPPQILGRIGQSCTHIVYKNGSASTLTRYRSVASSQHYLELIGHCIRLLNDPKPVVVGIAWVVECVEQRSRVDEEKFKVDLELVNVSGTNKVERLALCLIFPSRALFQRRRSMLPKHMAPPANVAGPSYIPVNLLSNDSGKRQPTDGEGSPGMFWHFFHVFTNP